MIKRCAYLMGTVAIAACMDAPTEMPLSEDLTLIEVPALDGLDINDVRDALPVLDARGIRDSRFLLNDLREGPFKSPPAGVDLSEAHVNSFTTTRGGTTVYGMPDELTMRVTDGENTTEVSRNPGSKFLHMADGTLWIAERNENAWTRYSASGTVTEVPHLGEWILFDAIGDSLLLGRKEDGKRRVRVVAR